MKKFLIIILIPLLQVNCYTQSNRMKLTDKVEITYKDILDLRLQILAAQMTSGSYRILDMGRLGFPVSITINNQNKIIFEIEGNSDGQFPKETQKEIMSEGFSFVKVGITELIRINFPRLDFDSSSNIIGYWYYKNANTPCAKWINNNFEWMKH